MTHEWRRRVVIGLCLFSWGRSFNYCCFENNTNPLQQFIQKNIPNGFNILELTGIIVKLIEKDNPVVTVFSKG
jgi:hypothetical protein